MQLHSGKDTSYNFQALPFAMCPFAENSANCGEVAALSSHQHATGKKKETTAQGWPLILLVC